LFSRVGGFCEVENYIYFTDIGEVHLSEGKLYRFRKGTKNIERIDLAGILIDPKGIKKLRNYFFVADINGIWKISLNNMSLTKLIDIKDFPIEPKLLLDIAVSPDGILYVSDVFSDVVYKFNTSGEIKIAFNVRRPSGIAIDDSNRIYVITFTSPASLYLYEKDTLKLLLRSNLIRAGYGLAINKEKNKLYATGLLSNNVVEIDLNTLQEKEIYKTKGRPTSILYSDNKLYVGLADENDFEIIELQY
jgi:DNA-binding beta-propeller fold protein YncE